MNMKTILMSGALTLALALTGCGGGGGTGNAGSASAGVGDGSSAGSGGSGNEGTDGTEKRSGYFIDAPVSGLSFQSSDGSDVKSNAFGVFKYSGDKVRVHLGYITLGTVTPDRDHDGLVTPEDLPNKDLVARLLQSIDVDGNLTNGIQIDPRISEVLRILEDSGAEDGKKNAVDFSTATEADITSGDPAPYIANRVDRDFDGKIDLSSKEAARRVSEAKMEFLDGKRPEDDGNIRWASEHLQDIEQNGTKKYFLGMVMPPHEYYELHGLRAAYATRGIPYAEKALGAVIVAYDIYRDAAKALADDSSGMTAVFKNVSYRSGSLRLFYMKEDVFTYQTFSESGSLIDPYADRGTPGNRNYGSGADYMNKLYSDYYQRGVSGGMRAMLHGACELEKMIDSNAQMFIVKGLIGAEEESDLGDYFKQLRLSSRMRYDAFDLALKKMGETKGCCSERSGCWKDK